VTCTGNADCTVSLRLTATETLRGRRVVAVGARKAKLTHRTVVLGTAKVTIKAGHKQTVRIGLLRVGRKLLAARRRLAARLRITQLVAGKNRAVSTQTVTFKARKHATR
jgi:hypothetical protein